MQPFILNLAEHNLNLQHFTHENAEYEAEDENEHNEAEWKTDTVVT